jgi:glucokinase
MSDYVIGVDLGGTRLRSALMDDDLAILNRQEVMTQADQGFDATYGRLVSAIRAVWPVQDAAVRGIGLSIPGPTNPFTGVVELGTNLAGWQGISLAKLLKDEFNIPVYLGNDANVAALAEGARGAADGYRHIIFVTVSTGIGGGIIVDGRMLLGEQGLAAEVGHMVMIVDGQVSTLEKEGAGPALARKARARIEAGEASMMRDLVSGDLIKITGKVVGMAAMEGDALAREIVARAGFVIGCGMVSLLHTFNPEILVFGGGVSTIGPLLFDPMREAIEKYCIDDAYWKHLKIERAALGENVSIVGAGALVVTRGGVEDLSAARAKLD